MKPLAVTTAVAVPLIFLLSWAWAAPLEVKAIEGSGSLFPEVVRSKVAKLTLEYREAIWPSQADFEKTVDRSAVPEAVIDTAEAWVKTMLKGDLLPADLSQRFIPLRRTMPFIPPEEVDYLVARYQIGDIQVQIQDAGVYISILINPLGAARASDVPEYIKSAAGKYLNLPPEVLAKGDLQLKSVDLSGGSRLYYGTLDYEYDPMMRNRAWWNRSYIWSDGSILSFHTIEREGIEGERNPHVGSRPGVPRRFAR
jgi:hypothetical protein